MNLSQETLSFLDTLIENTFANTSSPNDFISTYSTIFNVCSSSEDNRAALYRTVLQLLTRQCEKRYKQMPIEQIYSTYVELESRACVRLNHAFAYLNRTYVRMLRNNNENVYEIGDAVLVCFAAVWREKYENDLQKRVAEGGDTDAVQLLEKLAQLDQLKFKK